MFPVVLIAAPATVPAALIVPPAMLPAAPTTPHEERSRTELTIIIIFFIFIKSSHLFFKYSITVVIYFQ